MKNMIKTASLVFCTIFANSAWALSPPNLGPNNPGDPNDNIPWTDAGGTGNSANYGGVVDIVAAFNNGRRQEETQLNLTANSLGNLTLPSQAVWDTMTDDAKGLLILNAERVARAGMLTDVIGLPFAGIESHMDNISKNYGDILHDGDATGHNQPSGDSGLHGPSFRIEQDADIGSLHRTDIVYTSGSSPTHTGGGPHFYGDTFGGNGACHEFIARSENLAFFATTGTTASSIPLPLERSIYGFIYDDAGSNWGHREAALLQDETLSQVGQGWGFSNNNASNTHEGFLSIYVRSSADYKPFPSFPSNFGTIMVMNIFDPTPPPLSLIDGIIAIPLNPCHYNVTLDSANTGNAPGKVPTLSLPNNLWIQLALNTQPATGSTLTDIIGDDITGTYDTNWVIYRYETSTNAYVKLALTDTMLPGVGYWIIQNTGSSVTIDMPGSSSGVHVTHTPACQSSEGCYEIPLQTSASVFQWQMIGYPFRDSLSISALRVVTSSGNCSGGCTLSEAQTNNIFNGTLFHYNGTAYQSLTTGGTETFNPWYGVWAQTSTTANGLAPKLLIPAAPPAPFIDLPPIES
jgi:hypothetical protein